MKLKVHKEIYKNLLKEYASNDAFFTNIIGKGGNKGTGKKADNIATGEAKPYKDDTYLTQYEKDLPQLAKITQKLKNNEVKGSIEIFGPALEELLVLVRAKSPLKKDEHGEWILPMGDNLRLLQNDKRYFIKYIKADPNIKNTDDNESLVSNSTQG